MTEIWKTIIVALGGYTVILGWLFWWIGNRRLQSLLAQEKGQIQKDINRENAKFLSRHQKELEELKAQFTVEESIRKILADSFANAQSNVFERRLNCIEELWSSFHVLRDSMPSFLTYVDILLEDEFKDWIKRDDVQEIFGDLSMEKISQMIESLTGDIEKVRPFVGEYLWSLYFVYRAFSFRLVVFIFKERQEKEPKFFKNDNGLKQILRSVLSNSEFDNFITKEIGSIQYVSTLMESKFISHVDKIVTGKSSIQEGIEQARNIMLSAEKTIRESPEKNKYGQI